MLLNQICKHFIICKVAFTLNVLLNIKLVFNFVKFFLKLIGLTQVYKILRPVFS